MANRLFRRKMAYNISVVDLDAKMAIGAVGAVGTITGRGIRSAVKDSTGQYTFTLEDAFPAILSVNCDLVQATPDDKFMKVKAYDATAKTVTVVCWDISGAAAADPASGDEIHLHVAFRNGTSGVI